MAKIFRFLEDQDLERLLQVADKKRYEPEEFLIHEGDEQTGLFIIREGTVKVVREHVGFTVELSRHGPGEIFGEMSFIEGLPASASVQAEDGVQAIVISNRHILSLIREDPGFYGRFYHSLAEILSRRVRETTDLVSNSESPWGDG